MNDFVVDNEFEFTVDGHVYRAEHRTGGTDPLVSETWRLTVDGHPVTTSVPSVMWLRERVARCYRTALDHRDVAYRWEMSAVTAENEGVVLGRFLTEFDMRAVDRPPLF